LGKAYVVVLIVPLGGRERCSSKEQGCRLSFVDRAVRGVKKLVHHSIQMDRPTSTGSSKEEKKKLRPQWKASRQKIRGLHQGEYFNEREEKMVKTGK